MPTIKYKKADGTPVKGATTINKNVGWGSIGLMYWANNQGREGRTMQEAWDNVTEPGTITHYLVECDLKDEKPDLSKYKEEDIKKARIGFDNYLMWREQFNFEPIMVEPNLVHEVYGYGGTPDVIGKVKTKLGLLDWKGNKFYESGLLQLAAYSKLIEHNGIGTIDEFHVIRLPKSEDVPSFHHSYWKTLPPEAWKAFKCALELDKYQKVLKQLV
jgi:hypothetical protein